MFFMRLLQRKPNGEIVFREPTSSEVLAYAILSYTWGEEKVVYQDLKKSKDKSKTVDTCCIDKKNAVELGAAINFMFRWKSRWFTRGWTLQELIAPRLVDFFSSESGRLGSKLSLKFKICEITGIANKALRGDALSNFSIKKRRSWAKHRNTTIEENEAYCLIGIFDVSIVPNYGERKDQAFRRLEDKIHRMYKEVDFERFAVGLNLASFPEATQFIAKEKELSKMHELLQDHSSRSCVILHGFEGIRKTQLAITYARRYKEKYTAIFWLNANDENSLKLSFRDVAQQVLKHHLSNSVLSSVDQNKNFDQIVSVVKVWLDSPQNARWLIIYDNFDNPKTSGNPDNSAVDIRQFLPRSNHGSIIITTQSSQVKQSIRIYVQKLLDVKEGLQIVFNMSGRKSIKKTLVKELDGLPLALSTAGVYLEHHYKTSWLKLQTTSPLLDSYKDHELNFNKAITLLCTFGLVDPDRSPQQQVGARKYMFVLNKEWNKSLARLALTCVASEVLNTNEQYWWLLQRRLLQHATRQAFFIVDAKVNVNGLYWDFHNLGDLYFDQSKLAEAEAMYLRALEGKKKALGPDHTSTLSTVNNLGTLYKSQGKLAEAEAMYLRALEGKKKALGPDHTSTLDTVNNLGTLYKGQGKLAEAEAMYLRALEGKEKALGPDHTSTLDTVHNLGTLYSGQSKLAEAEAMYLRALESCKKALGPDHTSTLSTVNNLSNLYSDQSKLAEAKAMYLRALEGKKKALGPDHTSTLDTVHNLGTLYFGQSKLAEAKAMYLRALEGCYEDALGLELASSYLPALNTMFAFGDLFSQTDRKDMARAMYNRALSGYTTVQKPSSKRSKQVEDRLQALQIASAKSNVGQNEITEPGVANSRSLKQKIRKLKRRLNIK
ncbi:hypothetical protein B0O99DRAFT_665869 [Bisporella sp. PMI_857]|nr:hypothetical protein B0O99DRAFT_665869 [Bisporella sp. PMI_857]